MKNIRLTVPTILILLTCFIAGITFEFTGLFYEMHSGPKLITAGLPKRIRKVFKEDENVLRGKLGTRSSTAEKLDISCIFTKNGCLTVRELSSKRYEIKMLGEDYSDSPELQFLNQNYVGLTYDELETNRIVDNWAFPDSKTRKSKKEKLLSILERYN